MQVEYFYISDPELSDCLCIRSTCDTIRGGGEAICRRRAIQRAELRESRDLAHDCDCQSRVMFPHHTRGCYRYLHCARNAAGDVDSRK